MSALDLPPQKTLFVFGTRPEAIKLCPVVRYLRSGRPSSHVRVCVTGQHRVMLDQVLSAFEIESDIDLNVMQPGQTLSGLTSRLMHGLENVIATERPNLVIVQGDTTSTLCGALAAFYARIPVAHVEAGLRTGDLAEPFPEEANRVLTARLTTLHFPATEGAAQNLRAEGIPESSVVVTGQSGIDAILYVRDRLAAGTLTGRDWSALPPSRHLVVVTAHRRESFGEPFEQICLGLAAIARRPDVTIVFPVHLNPAVQEPVRRHLAALPNVVLIEPLDYVPFVDLMRRADLLITDSGGIQEEGPSLGKPVLVMRNKTERPEALAAGTVKLVGTSAHRIAGEASALLDDPLERQRMSLVHNPFGDGHASPRISAAIDSFFNENKFEF